MTDINKIKESNPKDAIGVTKTPFSTLSMPVLAEMGVGMLEGGVKYGRHNYRVIGVRASVYFDATLRHVFKWWEGEDIDPDSNISHLTKAMTSLHVLRDAEIHGKMFDDRPPRTPDGWMSLMDAVVKELRQKYPEPKEPYTQEGKKKITKSIEVKDVEEAFRRFVDQNSIPQLPALLRPAEYRLTPTCQTEEEIYKAEKRLDEIRHQLRQAEEDLRAKLERRQRGSKELPPQQRSA